MLLQMQLKNLLQSRILRKHSAKMLLEYPKHGAIIHNATRTTKLEAFPRIDFDEAVEKIIRK